MLSSLFQPEITTLESQILELQSQIAAAQARIAALGEAEFVASGVLQAVEEAVAKITGLAPGAIAALKASVLNLFDVGCESGVQNSDGGNQPISPAPIPDPLLNGESCAIDPDAHWQVAQPDGSSWELATPLCCLLEDCPESSLTGQAVEVSCWYAGKIKPLKLTHEGNGYQEWTAVDAILPETANTEVPDLFELVNLTPNVAYMRRTDSGEIACAYVGFSNKSLAKRWGEWLALNHSLASKFEIRPSKRLTDHKHELKLWSMSLKSIERLAESDLSKAPPSNHPPAPKREHPLVPTQIELDNFQPGDVVRSVTVRNWTYTILGVKDDGFLEVERIGTNPAIRSTLSPASVELVRRGGVVEIAAQEAAADLERQAQDAVDSIQPPAYNPNPIGRRGAAANWKAMQAAGGLNLKAHGTGLRTIDDYRREAEQELATTTSDDDF